jgi:hypothetical protein
MTSKSKKDLTDYTGWLVIDNDDPDDDGRPNFAYIVSYKIRFDLDPTHSEIVLFDSDGVLDSFAQEWHSKHHPFSNDVNIDKKNKILTIPPS